jgi:hypothetical protein
MVEKPLETATIDQGSLALQYTEVDQRTAKPEIKIL